MFVENGHDRNHLYSIIRENKRQAPKTENTNSNIVKDPKLRKELRKTRCKVIFTSAAKLKSILYNNKSKLLPNSYRDVYELSYDCGEEYIGETKSMCSLDQLNTKKIASQEMGSVGCN